MSSPDEFWRVPRGQDPDFGRKASVSHPVQIWYDGWRNRERVLRSKGRCVVCLRPTWAFDDGENDPRGVLGDSAYWYTDLTHNGIEYAVTTCALCANDYDRYQQAQQLGREMLDTGRFLLDGIRTL
jgi:hypothetical protein